MQDAGRRTVTEHPPFALSSEVVRCPLKRSKFMEPVIAHIKHEHRMGVNRLKGREGDQINPILAASAFNLRKILRSFFLFLLSWVAALQKRLPSQPVLLPVR